MGKFMVKSLLIAALCFGITAVATAGEFDEFKQLAEDTMKQVNGGSISDIDKLIQMQEKMVKIGAKACEQYAAKRPGDAKMLNLVATNADKMKSMSLSEIEAQWHEKGFLKSQGIDTALLEEKSVTGSLMDTVVHPATTFIALNDYKKSKDPALLAQVNDELKEVLHHIEMIK
jgi:hypothetical protein